MKLLKPFFLILFLFSVMLINSQVLDGELKRWHKVTLTFNGPNTSETFTPNPFSDYRLEVTFTHQDSNRSYVISGYYAACGNSENTSCDSGNKWRVHFTPDDLGSWTWSASFKSGSDVAINGGGSNAGFMNGDTGSFDIEESDKLGKDFRNKTLGRLTYVGERYLRHIGTEPTNPNGPWFVKAGADSPENAFHYEDFDGTPGTVAGNNRERKTWQPHQIDYMASDAGDYTWGVDKGTELLGVINYLSGEGANVMSFLTWASGGDDGAVFPHRLKVPFQEYESSGKAGQWDKLHKDRFDVSKLAQWEKIMEYADKKGVYLHFKTMETENCEKMDSHTFGRQRKLYYRELIARFGHHLALNWNLSEETKIKDEVVKSTTSYIRNLDAYNHHIVIHTYPNQQDQRYNPLLGDKSELTGASIQTSQNNIHNDVKRWIAKSMEAGKKWVVANDEQGTAGEGIRVSDKQVREKVLWATFIAGGAGVEYYSGYTNDDGDLNGQDHRKRGDKYKQGGFALKFFNDNLQPYLVDMVSSDAVTSDNKDYVLSIPGKVYAVYRPNGGSTGLNLPSGNNKYDVQWFNPRAGGSLTAKNTLGSNLVAPDNMDWVALILSKDDDGNGGGCDNVQVVSPSQDAYIQGTTPFNSSELRVESGDRVSYLQFAVPSLTEAITGTKLQMTVVTDGGNGLIEVYRGTSNNWTEGDLSDGNKPDEAVMIGSLNTTYDVGQSYQWNLSGIIAGETVSLIVKQTGGNDVSFSSKEGSNGPKLLLELDCNDGNDSCLGTEMNAVLDFPELNVDNFAPAYIDSNRNALAINASQYPDEFAAAEGIFKGDNGIYDVKLTTLTEIDGECTYRVLIDGTLIGEFKNPTTTTDYLESGAIFENIEIVENATVRVEFNSHTNGTIPEGNGTAYARGRWTTLDFICVDTDGGDGDENDCSTDFEERNGMVVIEAESIDIDGENWNEETGKSGFTGDGYLSWNGNNSFSNPGNGIITAKIKINTTGKYRFQWRNRIGEGTNSTEANDSWLKFPDASSFYGERNGAKVYPKGSGLTPNPNGAGGDGWFKIFLSGSTDWTWSTNTSDNDSHQIYAEFDTPGEYTLQISGRSKHHLIDRMVLYKEPNSSALDLSNAETFCDDALSTNEFAQLEDIIIYPNPTNNLVLVSGIENGDRIVIYDLFGKVVMTKKSHWRKRSDKLI